jgi:hypothetical protein
VFIHISTEYRDVPGHLTFNITRHPTQDSVVSVIDGKLAETSDIYASNLNDIYVKTNKDLHDVQDGTNQTLNSLNMSVNALSNQLLALKANDTKQKKEIADLKAAQSGQNNGLVAGAGAGIATGAVAGVASALALARRKPV